MSPGVDEGTYDPSILQWNHVVDVDVAGLRPGGSIIGGLPGAGSRSTGRVGDNGGAVPLQDVLTDRLVSIWTYFS